MLRNLFISKVRVKLLQTLLADPGEMYHVRELVRRTGEEINAVRRELARMEQAGMVKKEGRGNRLYYWFNKNHLLFFDLLSLIAKTTGIGAEIIKKRAKLGKVKFAMLSGRFARKLERKEDRVDLLIVGNIVLPELASIVRAEEAKREQEINYTVMTEEEFEFRKRRRDPFVLAVLSGSRVMLIGDEEELVS